MNLADARTAVAQTLTINAGINVKARQMGSPRALDGWVNLVRVEPADFACSRATLIVVVILGNTLAKAEDNLNELAVPMIDAITNAEEFRAFGVSLEPLGEIAVGTTATPLYALALTLTLEVE